MSGNCGEIARSGADWRRDFGCDDRCGRLWWRTEISNGTEARAMRNPNGLRSVLVALALTTSLAACSAISGRETAGEYVDDSTITTKVKAAMFDDPSLKMMQIGVETMQDVVQLSGFVDSAQTKARAGELARSVKGVREVKNDLVVR
jgi:hyperosmotically inducible periplasmic protein